MSVGGPVRFANVRGRAAIVTESDVAGGRAVDLEHASGGAFPSDPMSVFARWAELRELAGRLDPAGSVPFTRDELGPPSPRPSQVFGIGLNYREHAVETGAVIPETPLTFAKFASSINDPNGAVHVDVPTVDWEVELVVVVSDGGRDIAEDAGWNSVAGVCVGQDLSDRVLQRATQPPQFSLGKSRRGFAPFGPWVVDAATLRDRDSLSVHCSVNGVEVQRSRTDDMIFPVPRLVAYLSSIVDLRPGDVIFTGTPSGVGAARVPPRFLAKGDVVVSSIDDVGTITNRCV